MFFNLLPASQFFLAFANSADHYQPASESALFAIQFASKLKDGKTI